MGLGRIAVNSVLPAFARTRGCELAAFVSGDARKRVRLARNFGVNVTVGYEEYPQLLKSGLVDAVYLALPNELHATYVLQALRAGVHVLCEKPLAGTLSEASQLARLARKRGVFLMTAYRLRFEPATLATERLIQRGQLGVPRYFSSTYSIPVPDPSDIRLQPHSGGAVADVGVYCINAVRHLFNAEPIEVFAMRAPGAGPRLPTGVLLRFTEGRMAAFTVSFNTPYTGEYRVVCSRGILEMNPGYTYRDGLRRTITVGSKSTVKVFPVADQFRDELDAFANLVRSPRRAAGWAEEGVADLRVIDAIERSLRDRAPVGLPMRAASKLRG